VDAALIHTDGNEVFECTESLTLPYTEEQRARIRETVYMRGDLPKIEQELTLIHADAVKALLKKANKKALPCDGAKPSQGEVDTSRNSTSLSINCNYRYRVLPNGIFCLTYSLVPSVSAL